MKPLLTDESIANTFNKFFYLVAPDLHSEVHFRIIFFEYLLPPNQNSFFISTRTKEEIIKRISTFKPNPLLTPDREHGKVFEKVPITGFRRAKSLKDIFVRAKVALLGCCVSSGGTRCKICKLFVTTEAFRSFTTQRE